tara:strand:- start:304 stop:438 length:135 start_codon:yes stop_codon:yes gene_type:complete
MEERKGNLFRIEIRRRPIYMVGKEYYVCEVCLDRINNIAKGLKK